MTKRDKPHVLVVNQHGDNRGDEAALLAMCSGIEAELGPTQFTVRYVVFLAFRVLKVRPYFLLGNIGKATIAAYETADVVVSAPGGPYFGDLYVGHEPVHWLYVWVARLHRVPVVLYATSAGPFQKRWANPFRRYTYRCFTRLFVREEISAGHIRKLFAGRRRNVNVEVSVDSALQVSVSPMNRRNFMESNQMSAEDQLIVVSAIHWPYPNDPSPQLRQKEYDAAVIEAIKVFAEGQPTHVVFVPQLYRSIHRDTPYLETLARQLPEDISREILSETKSSNEQRSLFAIADWVIAGRYHPAVFAVSSAVPVLCIAYEHKATGVLQVAGVPDAVLSIDDVTVEAVQAKARELLAGKVNLMARLNIAQVNLRGVSSRTSVAVADVVRRS